MRRVLSLNNDRCYRCRTEASPLTRISDGHKVCNSCLAKYYERCDICGDYADRDEILYTGGFCENCYDDEDE